MARRRHQSLALLDREVVRWRTEYRKSLLSDIADPGGGRRAAGAESSTTTSTLFGSSPGFWAGRRRGLRPDRTAQRNRQARHPGQRQAACGWDHMKCSRHKADTRHTNERPQAVRLTWTAGPSRSPPERRWRLGAVHGLTLRPQVGPARAGNESPGSW
jgi:hypothetical protein